MFKFKKLFICFMLVFMCISTSVLAVQNPDVKADASNSPASISEDLYITNSDSYTLSDIVYGNIYASTKKFVTNPLNNGGIVNGNLFLISSQVSIESKVTFSDTKDKYGNYIVTSHTPHSIINGNAYILADSFELQAGSEIHGDLYVAANSVKIDQDAIIDGNIYITASSITLNGQITGSVYVTASEFTMNYFTYIARDLFLNTQNATLSGVVYRNAFITADGNVKATSDFRVSNNLVVNSALDFSFSGEVQGNAKINAQNLHFNKDENTLCTIKGNLEYGTQKETSVPDGIVAGSVSTFKYEDKISHKVSIKSIILSLLTLLVYVLGVVILCKKLAPNATSNLPELSFANVLKSLGFGLLSLVAIGFIFIILCLVGVGVSLAFFVVFAYLFVVGLAFPLLINQIAEKLNFKMNTLLKILIVTILAYVIKCIPFVGSTLMFMALVVGIGQILMTLFKRNK